jgi:hypothetical protein
MQVRKSSFKKDLEEKEAAFLRLTGEERIRLMRIVAERSRKPGVDYELRNKRVKVIRLT